MSKQRQLSINWEAQPSTPESGVTDESTGDPLCDAVNDLLEAHWLFELMGDDICMDIIYEDIRKLADRKLEYANKKMRAFLLENNHE